MSNKVMMDERIQLEHYKAGYYAFMVTFPLMTTTFMLLGFEATRNTFYPVMSGLITYYSAIMIFGGYLAKKSPRIEAEEKVQRPKKKSSSSGCAIAIVVIVLVPIGSLLLGILSGSFLDDLNIESAEEVARSIMHVVIPPLAYYFYYRQAKKKSVSHGEA